jgi:hypothetical protein
MRSTASMLAHMEKATFRLPEWEMRRLREESTRQHRSLNLVVIDIIARGLGEPAETEPDTDLVRVLGSMVARPPLFPFEPEPREEGDDDEVNLTDALGWARGER